MAIQEKMLQGLILPAECWLLQPAWAESSWEDPDWNTVSMEL